MHDRIIFLAGWSHAGSRGRAPQALWLHLTPDVPGLRACPAAFAETARAWRGPF